MAFYATSKHHSQVGYWHKLNASTLSTAKREASKKYRGDMLGSVIHVVECGEQDIEHINFFPACTKRIEAFPTKWNDYQ